MSDLSVLLNMASFATESVIYKEANVPSADFISGWSLKAAVREYTGELLFANKTN